MQETQSDGRAARGFWSGPWPMVASFIPGTLQMWLLFPTTSLLLAQRGISPTAIGIFSALPWGVVLLVMPILPRLIARLGVVPTYRASLLLALLTVLGFYLTDSTILWFCLNAAFGIALSLRWLIADSWVAATPAEHERGRVIGVYETLLGGAIAGGPLLLSLLGTEHGLPFLVSLGLLGVAFLIALPMRNRALAGATGEKPSTIVATARRHPSLLLAVLLCGICESAVVSIFPVYGLAVGFDAAGAALLVTLIGVGTILGQLPLGLFADRFDARKLTFVCAALVAAGLLLAVPLDPLGDLVWVLRVPFGAAFGGLYTLAMVQAGQRFHGSEMLHAMAAVTATYTLGGMVGPAVAGPAFDAFGPDGLLISMGLLALAVTAALGLDLRRPDPPALRRA